MTDEQLRTAVTPLIGLVDAILDGEPVDLADLRRARDAAMAPFRGRWVWSGAWVETSKEDTGGGYGDGYDSGSGDDSGFGYSDGSGWGGGGGYDDGDGEGRG